MARLVIFDEFVRGIDLARQPLILGRSRRADVPIRDRLLSRKHCTIVPVDAPQPGGSGFRVIDLKSSNGTFVNGVRVEERDLEYDDIIEIGNTVMVLLATDSFRSGKKLPRVRNAAKAEELIRAIRRREVPAGDSRLAGLMGSGPQASWTAGLRQKWVLTNEEAEFLEWARKELPGRPVLQSILEAYLEHQIGSLLLRHVPELSEALSSAMEKILVRENFEGDASRLEEAVRSALCKALVDALGGPPAGAPPETGGGPDSAKVEEGP